MDYDAFVKVPMLDAQDAKTVQRVLKAEDFDFQLRPDAVAVDRGIRLPNVNDAFAGARRISARSKPDARFRTTARGRDSLSERPEATRGIVAQRPRSGMADPRSFCNRVTCFAMNHC